MRRNTRRTARKAAIRDARDNAAMREFYARMLPHEREAWLLDNPSFKDDDHSALTVLQWREHARIRNARGTAAAHAYADTVRAQQAPAPRGTWSSDLTLTRGDAAFVTLMGHALKAGVILPLAYAVGGVAILVACAIALGIYATITLLGSIISARAL